MFNESIPQFTTKSRNFSDDFNGVNNKLLQNTIDNRERIVTAEEKLSGIDEGANNYKHPASHQASMIVQDSSRRFVSDSEKSTWNAKETTEGSLEKANAALQTAKNYADGQVEGLERSVNEKTSELEGAIIDKVMLNGTATNVNFISDEKNEVIKMINDKPIFAEIQDKKINDKFKSNNLLNDHELVLDKYCNQEGYIGSHSGYCLFQYVEVSGGVTYHFYPTARYIVLFNNNKTFLSSSGHSTVDADSTFTPSEDGFVCITAYKERVNLSKLYTTGLQEDVVEYKKTVLSENVIIKDNGVIDIINKNMQSFVDNTLTNKIDKRMESIRSTSNLLTFSEFHQDKYFDTYLNAKSEKNYSYFKLKITNGIEYNVSPRARFIILTNNDNNKVGNSYTGEVFEDTKFTAISDGYAYITVYNVDLPNVFCYITGQANAQPVGKYLLDENIIFKNESNNILKGKKWVSCGDSFTAGGYSTRDGIDETLYKYQDGLYVGKQITYPYIIGLRNEMVIINEAVSGSTMALNSKAGAGSFAGTRYKNIPSDADYITLYFGINDDNYTSTVGTINDTDTSTFYGAWNTVLEYLITNHPYAKIGIIITNGSNPKYTEATRNIAKKWGIPYLDLEMDYNVPLMHRATERPELCDKAKQLRLQAFRISSTNTHPNVKAHEYQSTFIENFLRSL